MKTPDEIKKGLRCYRAKHPHSIGRCPEGCPYEKNGEFCRNMLNMDALAYIQQLESRLAQVERERDAAVCDLEELTTRVSSLHLDCDYCKDKYKPICNNCNWQWRGVCEENTKEE